MKRILLALLIIVISLFIIFQYAKSQSSAVIELNSDYTWNWINGSPTPIVITTTPGPSQTPWIITATPDAILTHTPTPEIITPVPTDTPKDCFGTVNTAVLNVRPEPYGLPVLGQVTYGIELPFFEKWLDQYDDWWWAYWWDYDSSVRGWVHSGYIKVGTQADCSKLKDVTPPVSHSAALLWHTVPGFNWNNAVASFGILQNYNIEFGIKPYADIDKCIAVLEAGGMCIYRHGAPDCPEHIGEGNATESALNFLHRYGTTAKLVLAGYEKAYYEPLNECNYGSPESAMQIATLHWWSDWLLAYIKAAHEEGLPKLVIPTFGIAGAYKEHYYYWKQVYQLSASYGNLAGEHIYTPYTDGGLCPYDQWLADRYVLDEQWRQEYGINIGVAITEVAPGWGNDPVDVADFVCWYNRVRNVPHIVAVAFWTMGYHPTWPNANLDNYVISIAYAVSSKTISNNRFEVVPVDR